MTSIPRALHARLCGIGALLAILAAPAWAADRVVTAKTQPDLKPGLAAMPQIDAPADDAERRINAALRRFDGKVLKAVAACRAQDSKHSGWTRKVRIPMRGPRFISFVIVDDVYCGGAYPNSDQTAIVYDLTTGNPVDWTTLLPPLLTGKVELAQGQDGTKTVTLASKRLHALYLDRYRPKGSAAQREGDDAECREVVAEMPPGEPPAMTVWLDAEAGGLAVRFDLIHALKACADTVVIPTAVLRREGARPVLTDALDAARAAQSGR